ncbi:MAG: nucleotidyltransferase family protein [Chloroflexota bacterium]
MQAIVLAGGRGERLLPFTAEHPKCLVEVAGRPVALRQLSWLAANGVDEVIFSCGYRWLAIRDRLGDGAGLGLRVRYAPEDEPLGRGGGLRLAMGLLNGIGTFLVINGDVLTQPPLADFVARHRASQALATVLVVPYVSDDAIVESDAEWRVTAFREKPRLPYWINGGLYLMEPGIRDLLPERGDHETSTLPALAAAGRLSSLAYEGPWFSIDSHADIKAAERAMSDLEPK